MKIIGVNNIDPGNQGVTVYFDGMDTAHIQDALGLLWDDMKNRTYPKADEDDPVSDEEFRDFLRGQVFDLLDGFADLNRYMDSINPNLNGDGE